MPGAKQSVALFTLSAVLGGVVVGEVSAEPGVRASADIYSCSGGQFLGTAAMQEESTEEGVKQVRVSIHIEGISPGKHAVHIHEVAQCSPCSAAGGHFDPGPAGDSSPDGNHPYHSGDLVNIEVNRAGIGNLNVSTNRITLSQGPLSVFDADGSAFIIHDLSDTYCPEGAEPGCAGGSRAACGIIVLE